MRHINNIRCEYIYPVLLVSYQIPTEMKEVYSIYGRRMDLGARMIWNRVNVTLVGETIIQLHRHPFGMKMLLVPNNDVYRLVVYQMVYSKLVKLVQFAVSRSCAIYPKKMDLTFGLFPFRHKAKMPWHSLHYYYYIVYNHKDEYHICPSIPPCVPSLPALNPHTNDKFHLLVEFPCKTQIPKWVLLLELLQILPTHSDNKNDSLWQPRDTLQLRRSCVIHQRWKNYCIGIYAMSSELLPVYKLE
mmetsp:Transcript_31415/g.45974  ORF Transcript_31415/g.45974 Transcript_31415/m.45974 type:complete len:244 (-) Transcript_31415:523-1254(-)